MRNKCHTLPHTHFPSLASVGSGARPAAAELAQQLAAGAPYAVGHAKQLVYMGHERPLEEVGEIEGVMITGAMATNDGKEGIAAFIEKRAANFIGT